MQETDLLSYLAHSLNVLLKRGSFINGDEFRPTQKEALEAYQQYLARTDLTDHQKLVGFFTIPTGVGKTAIFLSLLEEVYKLTQRIDTDVRSVIVVPRLALFAQTKRAMRKYSPALLHHVGFFWGTKERA